MSKVDDLVIELKLTCSEDLFDIEYPPEHQCSKIDSVVRDINSAEKALDRALKYDDRDDIIEYVDEAKSDLYNMTYELEELREAIIGVRDWGQQWKDLCKELLDEKDNLKGYLELEEV